MIYGYEYVFPPWVSTPIMRRNNETDTYIQYLYSNLALQLNGYDQSNDRMSVNLYCHCTLRTRLLQSESYSKS